VRPRLRLPAASAPLLVAPLLAYLLWSSGAVSPLAALVAMLVVALVVHFTGSLLLRAANASNLPVTAAWVLGVAATSIGVYLLAAVLQVIAATAFAIWSALMVAAAAALRRRPAATAAMTGADLAGLALCAAATVFWCGEMAQVPRVLASEGVLATWVDQFIHGGVISQLGDPRAAGHGIIELAGVPAFFYHYASYALPAALAWPLDLPGLTLATSLWVPLGFFTLCAAAYTLGSALASRAGGLAALGVLTLLPDGASYGLYNRLFGYYWYVIAVPGASYAVATSLLSVALLCYGWTTRNRGLLLVGFCLAAALALIRFHIFLLAFPAWLATAALAVPIVRRRLGLFIGAALAAFGLFVWAFYALFRAAPHGLALYLDVAHNQQHPTLYRGLYAGLTYYYGPAVAVPVGVLLVLLATFSMFTFLYPVSVWLARRSRGLHTIDAMPVVLAALYLLLILTAPVPSHGDATELTQRPFVLVYAVTAIWTACGFVSWIETRGAWQERRIWLPLVVCAALGVIWVLQGTVRDWRWAYEYRVAAGLPAAARFVREHGRPGEVLAVQGLKPSLETTDLAVQLASMTGMPAYLSRPYMRVAQGGALERVALQRYGELGRVARETSAPAALARLRGLGVQWYVVAQRDRSGPRWDPQRRHAVFVDDMVAVYSTREVAR
jgi:hypothetical protein